MRGVLPVDDLLGALLSDLVQEGRVVVVRVVSVGTLLAGQQSHN